MIYLDHNATSPLLPEVLAAMSPWFGVPANPSSVHRAGQSAAMAVERAREQVAALVGARPRDVVFTSGATEANHTFLRGVGGAHIAVSAIEHPSVHGAAAALAARGTIVETIAVGSDGVVQLDAWTEGRAGPLALISVMRANHETGAIQPVPAALARSLGAKLHVDATQAAGRISLEDLDADGIVLSSHKLGGPGGVGALVVRDGKDFPALLTGGSQERGRRAGTVNVAGVVGFGAACALARAELHDRQARWQAQSARLLAGLLEAGARLVGPEQGRLPNTTCVVFPGQRGETVVQRLDLQGVCVSSGAACASGSLDPSPVLLAMGDAEPEGAVRFSLGPRTADADIDAVLSLLRPTP